MPPHPDNLEGRNKVPLLWKSAFGSFTPISTQMRTRPLTFVCFHYVNGVNACSQIANRKSDNFLPVIIMCPSASSWLWHANYISPPSLLCVSCPTDSEKPRIFNGKFYCIRIGGRKIEVSHTTLCHSWLAPFGEKKPHTQIAFLPWNIRSCLNSWYCIRCHYEIIKTFRSWGMALPELTAFD